jgi:hypothetical protein
MNRLMSNLLFVHRFILHQFIHEKLPPSSILDLIIFLDLLQVIAMLFLWRDTITSMTFVIRESAVFKGLCAHHVLIC